MKVLHIIAGISRRAGGPARSVQGLVAAECAAGIDAWVWPIGGGEPWVEGVRLFEISTDRRSLCAAKSLEWCSDRLIVRLKQFDLVHIHGIWSCKLHRVAVMCRRAGVPYVIAPRGRLEPWSLKQKWLKKRIARWLYQDRDLKGAAALHATAESEAEQFRRLGFKNKIIVSPNGVNVPGKGTGKREEGKGGEDWSERRRALAEKKVEEWRRALFVSRMHPKKGVLELVESWARLKQSNNRTIEQWCCELVYTMNSDEELAYEQKVKQRVHELGLDGQFVFTGALDDEKKWEAYARADLFVLPTYSENFGIVVAEALWAGVPVITTKGTPWAELECSESSKFKVQSSKLEERCGWWVELSALDAALREAIEQSNNPNNRTILREMGARGRKLIEEHYTWSAVCDKMIKGYEEVLNGRA